MSATYDELGIVSAALDKCPALQKPRPYGAAPTYHRAGAGAVAGAGVGVVRNDGPARTSTPTMAMMMMMMAILMITFIMTMIGMRKGRQADGQTESLVLCTAGC